MLNNFQQKYYLAGPAIGASLKITASPVEYNYSSFITIDRYSDVPVYLQVTNQMILAINRGILKSAQKLIGTRQLADQLGIHRNTASASYDELHSQGWVEILPNKGTFVASFLPKTVPNPKRENHYPSRTGYSFKKSFLFDNPFEYIDCRYVWNDGSPDIRLTQLEDLSRVYSANLKRRSNRKKMGYYNQEGSEYFKEQLAAYLAQSRGLKIEPSNLLITRSMEMSLYMLSEVILTAGDLVLVGELSYFSANMIFQKSGSKLMTVPVDDEGMDMDHVRKICQNHQVRMVHVSPHVHYPSTVSLSPRRRMELLRLAKEYGFIIVEDDQEYDFQYDKPALVPLASHDEDGMVIYVSSFGKSLAPGFRTGFIVAPENLIIELRKHLGMIDRQGDVLMEQALGELIEDGSINRHLKKSLKIYRSRRNDMAVRLMEELGDEIDFQIPNAGLAFWLTWKKPINLYKLSQLALKNDLYIPKTLLYQNNKLTGMRVGFGHLDQVEMEETILIVKEVLKTLAH